ncbi:NADPH-dependent FMN reductase [Micromonospora rosaria]|uniref:NADPH-dependent FMN reductase n=1 Tax=Micromonospora rosaria TaxID=47874 RepID=A0A136PK75_9ACTN|nr:FMN reductase [Micromonospora rosaria]KXK58808.1 NADPH-dependent FMN reductase [Micromonospora rosaria]
MSERTLVVLSAGLRQPSSTRLLADQLAAAVADEAARRELTLRHRTIEVREHAHDVVNNLLTGFPSAALGQAVEQVTAADGLIAVSPIFGASYSGIFKSFLDVLDRDALAGKPVVIAATGGTARHSLALEHALRPLFSHVRAVVVPTGVFAAPEDWSDGGADGALRTRIRRAAAELAEQIVRYPGRTPTDPFALTTSFDDLLAPPAP